MIKTQEDVKNDVKSKKRSVTEKLKNNPLPEETITHTPEPTVGKSDVSDILDIFDERISNIETYLDSTSNIIVSLEQIPTTIIQISHAIEMLNAQLENISNNMVGFAELEDNRYNELADMITNVNNALIQLDQLIPIFVDSRIDEKMTDKKMKVGGEPLT